jgi:hypothetical protein
MGSNSGAVKQDTDNLTYTGYPTHPITDATMYFSNDYASARGRFLHAAEATGARLHSLELDARGPSAEALSIDIAWLGDSEPRRVLLHTCGLHGVEGFAGSAIQLRALLEPPQLAPGIALVFAHILNPYGMAWIRRTNENNVDLNRNFPSPGQCWRGAPDPYRRLHDLLNPASPPTCDAFMLRVLLKLLRHGLRQVSQAVAAGQYDYPLGLFFGGRQLEQGPRLYLEWLARHLRCVGYVLAVDVHTGLGPRGKESLFVSEHTGSTRSLIESLEPRRFIDAPYHISGGIDTALATSLPGLPYGSLTQEFGTRAAIEVLGALREENRWHHYGAGHLDHPSKRRLLNAFCPPDPRWRKKILDQGDSLLRRALVALGCQQAGC